MLFEVELWGQLWNIVENACKTCLLHQQIIEAQTSSIANAEGIIASLEQVDIDNQAIVKDLDDLVVALKETNGVLEKRIASLEENRELLRKRIASLEENHELFQKVNGLLERENAALRKRLERSEP